jgi:hypothetical protein
MASPPNDSSWWDLIQQWKTGALTIIGLGMMQGIRMWLSDYKDKRNPDAKADRADKAEARQWLSQQDRRVRETVERTDSENVRLRTRIDELESDVERERKSGMGHYEHSLRLFDYIVQLVHDWRNGKSPPEKVSDFDKI